MIWENKLFNFAHEFYSLIISKYMLAISSHSLIIWKETETISSSSAHSKKAFCAKIAFT